MTRSTVLDIQLRGRDYQVSCTPEERDALLAAVAHVETQMEELAQRTRGSGERLAVMTALNLAHALLAKPAGAEQKTVEVETPATATVAAAEPSLPNFDNPEIVRRIDAMVARLDAVLTQQESLL